MSDGSRILTIPRHNPVNEYTMGGIVRDAGLTIEKFKKLLYQDGFSRVSLMNWDAIRAALPEVDAQFIKDTREKLRCSRALFARRLWMNERTLEKWEQGRAKPNSQAVALLLLVRHFPDTLERLRRIATAEPS